MPYKLLLQVDQRHEAFRRLIHDIWDEVDKTCHSAVSRKVRYEINFTLVNSIYDTSSPVARKIYECIQEAEAKCYNGTE